MDERAYGRRDPLWMIRTTLARSKYIFQVYSYKIGTPVVGGLVMIRD